MLGQAQVTQGAGPFDILLSWMLLCCRNAFAVSKNLSTPPQPLFGFTVVGPL